PSTDHPMHRTRQGLRQIGTRLQLRDVEVVGQALDQILRKTIQNHYILFHGHAVYLESENLRVLSITALVPDSALQQPARQPTLRREYTAPTAGLTLPARQWFP